MPRRALVVLLLVSRVAVADIADDQRLAAEQLAKDAFASHDRTKLVACGKAYLDVYNADPARPDGDEVLYNSAICFSEARSVSAAIATWDQVLVKYPHSKLGAKAVMQIGMAYLAIAEFDRAASRFEDYAKRFAGEKDARDALSNAVMLRTALGDRDKRIADTRQFVLMYGAKAPAEAANATLALVSAYDAPEDQAKALRDYIKTYGGKGSHEQLAQAYQRLGDALWRQSCPVHPIDGLCAKLVPDKTQHCGTSTVRHVAVARTAVRTEALAAYDQAIKVVDEAGLTDPAARHAAAMARLARADDLLETMFARPFPSIVDAKTFNPWLTAMTKDGEAANQAYTQVLATKDASASIAAAARIGQLNERFSAVLAAGVIPPSARTGKYAADATKAYCDQMSAVSEPLHEHALEAFGLCTTKAIELGVFDEWTALCRRETKTAVAEIQPEITLEVGDLAKLDALPRTDPARRTLAADIDLQQRTALATGRDPAAYVVLAMLALDDKRFELARGLIDQSMVDDDKNALLYAARAVIAARRGDWTHAHESAERAVDIDPKSEVALRTSGLVAAHVGLFDVAKARLASVKEQTYEVVLARAIAARGLGDQKTAEALYQQALRLGPGRSEAQRDLDLLHDPSLGR